MDRKLRRWLGSRCWKQPDGTWLVHPGVFLWPPPPSFILPDEAAKTAYVDRAVPPGRFNLHNDFILQNMLLSFTALTSASGTLGFDAPLWLVVVLAATMLATMLVCQYRLAPSEEERLRSWLRRAGREAGVEAGRLGEEPERPWRRIPYRGLKRCRPGWMVALDASVKAAFVAAVVLLSFRSGHDCKRAQDAWWKAGEGWAAFPGECVGWHSLFALPVAGLMLALAVGMVWDWWRWNVRRT